VLRRSLIAASDSTALRRVAEEVPAARAVAMRFVAGETLDHALAAADDLTRRGMAVSLDYLGESVDDPSVAEQAAEVYRDALDRLATIGADASVSCKPTQLGVEIDRDLCRELLGRVSDHAASTGAAVTLDMEGSRHTQSTVDLVLALRGLGHANVGCAVQAYLHRTPDDVAKLTAAGASLRLCKGAYAEPPEIAHQDRREVDAAYARLADRLLRVAPYPRIATHDHRLIHHAKNAARRHQRPPDDFEFQMLYGVRTPLQQALVADGYRVRIYVPFGGEWYPYFMRRLAERPANLVFFLRALLGNRG
jgi:proline dehydrogenase